METAKVTCPHCGAIEERTIPTNKSEAIYTCKACGNRVKTKDGMCCVICSHSDGRCAVSVKSASDEKGTA